MHNFFWAWSGEEGKDIGKNVEKAYSLYQKSAREWNPDAIHSWSNVSELGTVWRNIPPALSGWKICWRRKVSSLRIFSNFTTEQSTFSRRMKCRKSFFGRPRNGRLLAADDLWEKIQDRQRFRTKTPDEIWMVRQKRKRWSAGKKVSSLIPGFLVQIRQSDRYWTCWRCWHSYRPIWHPGFFQWAFAWNQIWKRYWSRKRPWESLVFLWRQHN